MIISHKHKFIFIKTRKTAGTSLEIALSSICDKDDIITTITPEDEIKRKELGFTSAQNYHIPLRKYKRSDLSNLITKGQLAIYYSHMPAQEIKDYIGHNIWNSYYKFCFERNPFDKVVSHYYWINSTLSEKYDSIYEYMCDGYLSRIKGYDLYAINKMIAVNDVFKYEDLANALKTISDRLNLNKVLTLPAYKAKSQYRKDKRNYREILTDKEKEIIEIAFAREIKLLRYGY